MFQYKCPNNCGKWVAKRDIENHAMYLCKHSEVICMNCDLIDKPLRDNFHHNCVQNLKNMVLALSKDKK